MIINNYNNYNNYNKSKRNSYNCTDTKSSRYVHNNKRDDDGSWKKSNHDWNPHRSIDNSELPSSTVIVDDDSFTEVYPQLSTEDGVLTLSIDMLDSKLEENTSYDPLCFPTADTLVQQQLSDDDTQQQLDDDGIQSCHNSLSSIPASIATFSHRPLSIESMEDSISTSSRSSVLTNNTLSKQSIQVVISNTISNIAQSPKMLFSSLKEMCSFDTSTSLSSAFPNHLNCFSFISENIRVEEEVTVTNKENEKEFYDKVEEKNNTISHRFNCYSISDYPLENEKILYQPTENDTNYNIENYLTHTSSVNRTTTTTTSTNSSDYHFQYRIQYHLLHFFDKLLLKNEQLKNYRPYYEKNDKQLHSPFILEFYLQILLDTFSKYPGCSDVVNEFLLTNILLNFNQFVLRKQQKRSILLPFSFKTLKHQRNTKFSTLQLLKYIYREENHGLRIKTKETIKGMKKQSDNNDNKNDNSDNSDYIYDSIYDLNIEKKLWLSIKMISKIQRYIHTKHKSTIFRSNMKEGRSRGISRIKKIKSRNKNNDVNDISSEKVKNIIELNEHIIKSFSNILDNVIEDKVIEEKHQSSSEETNTFLNYLYNKYEKNQSQSQDQIHNQSQDQNYNQGQDQDQNKIENQNQNQNQNENHNRNQNQSQRQRSIKVKKRKRVVPPQKTKPNTFKHKDSMMVYNFGHGIQPFKKNQDTQPINKSFSSILDENKIESNISSDDKLLKVWDCQHERRCSLQSRAINNSSYSNSNLQVPRDNNNSSKESFIKKFPPPINLSNSSFLLLEPKTSESEKRKEKLIPKISIPKESSSSTLSPIYPQNSQNTSLSPILPSSNPMISTLSPILQSPILSSSQTWASQDPKTNILKSDDVTKEVVSITEDKNRQLIDKKDKKPNIISNFYKFLVKESKEKKEHYKDLSQSKKNNSNEMEDDSNMELMSSSYITFDTEVNLSNSKNNIENSRTTTSKRDKQKKEDKVEEEICFDSSIFSHQSSSFYDFVNELSSPNTSSPNTSSPNTSEERKKKEGEKEQTENERSFISIDPSSSFNQEEVFSLGGEGEISIIKRLSNQSSLDAPFQENDSSQRSSNLTFKGSSFEYQSLSNLTIPKSNILRAVPMKPLRDPLQKDKNFLSPKNNLNISCKNKRSSLSISTVNSTSTFPAYYQSSKKTVIHKPSFASSLLYAHNRTDSTSSHLTNNEEKQSNYNNIMIINFLFLFYIYFFFLLLFIIILNNFIDNIIIIH